MFQAIARAFQSATISTPPKSWDTYARLTTQYTGDYHHLCEYEWVRLFIYNEIMNRKDKHLLGEDARFKGTCFTTKKYEMYVKDLGDLSYPVALRADQNQEREEKWGELRGPATLKGELYLVRPLDAILNIDRALENGVRFRRQRIKVMLPYRHVRWVKERTKVEDIIGHNSILDDRKMLEVEAYAYIGKSNYWKELIAKDFVGPSSMTPSYLMRQGEIFTPRNPELEPYYHFKGTNGQ